MVCGRCDSANSYSAPKRYTEEDFDVELTPEQWRSIVNDFNRDYPVISKVPNQMFWEWIDERLGLSSYASIHPEHKKRTEKGLYCGGRRVFVEPVPLTHFERLKLYDEDGIVHIIGSRREIDEFIDSGLKDGRYQIYSAVHPVHRGLRPAVAKALGFEMDEPDVNRIPAKGFKMELEGVTANVTREGITIRSGRKSVAKSWEKFTFARPYVELRVREDVLAQVKVSDEGLVFDIIDESIGDDDDPIIGTEWALWYDDIYEDEDDSDAYAAIHPAHKAKLSEKTKALQLRVWWVRNPPRDADYYPVKSVEEAVKVIKRETRKDLRNPSIHDNACGLEVFEDGEWSEYYDEYGRDIDEIMDEEDVDAYAAFTFAEDESGQFQGLDEPERGAGGTYQRPPVQRALGEAIRKGRLPRVGEVGGAAQSGIRYSAVHPYPASSILRRHPIAKVYYVPLKKRYYRKSGRGNRRLRVEGRIPIEANSEEDALEIVSGMLDRSRDDVLQTVDARIEWDEQPDSSEWEYIDYSFEIDDERDVVPEGMAYSSPGFREEFENIVAAWSDRDLLYEMYGSLRDIFKEGLHEHGPDSPDTLRKVVILNELNRRGFSNRDIQDVLFEKMMRGGLLATYPSVYAAYEYGVGDMKDEKFSADEDTEYARDLLGQIRIEEGLKAPEKTNPLGYFGAEKRDVQASDIGVYVIGGILLLAIIAPIMGIIMYKE